MASFETYEPRSRTPLEVQQSHVQIATRAQGTAEAYRREAQLADEGPRREALARYAVGYQHVADTYLKLAAIAPADNLTEPPIPRSELIS